MAFAAQAALGLLFFLAALGAASFTAAWALLKGWRARAAVSLGATGAGLVLTAGLVAVSRSLGGGEGVLEALRASLEAEVGAHMERLARTGLSEARLALWRAYLSAFPARLAMDCLLYGLAAYHFASAVLNRLSRRVPRPIPFREFVVPEPLVFGFLAGALLKLAAPSEGVAAFLADNLLVFFTSLYLLAGWSLLAFALWKARFPGVLRFLIHLFAFLTVFQAMFHSAHAVFLLAAPGLLDLWFDFRGIQRRAAGKSRP